MPGEMFGVKLLAAALAALAFAETAHAVPPVLNSLSHRARHATASFSAPRASDVTVYIATKPDRASDGNFLSENVKDIDFLTDSEIQAGTWLHEDQLVPGAYYVMLHASPDFSSCYDFERGTFDPACANGYSNVVRLEIPKPASRYTVSFRRYRFLGEFSFTLSARPLGESRPYRLCYRLRSRRRVCLRGTLNGYDWNGSASDTLTVSTRNLSRSTTFVWYVGGAAVARRTLRR